MVILGSRAELGRTQAAGWCVISATSHEEET